jgi:branched-chain amino acid transport system ATP-binding protein
MDPREGETVALLDIEELIVRSGGVTALDGPTLEVEAGQICGLIGPNGAGKTTLFNCVSRLYTPRSGRIVFDGTDLLAQAPHEISRLGIARTFQNLGLFPTMSVRENVMLGAYHRNRPGLVASALRLGAAGSERALRSEADDVLGRLELDELAGHAATGLPYGTLKRVELARALLQRPRLLMLDEPASGLSHSEAADLADLIRALRDELDLTVLLVEHNMSLVMGLCEHVVVLDLGRKIAEGPPREVQEHPAVVEVYLGTPA